MFLPIIKSAKPTGIKAFCEEGVMKMEAGAAVVIVIWYQKGTHHAVKRPLVPHRGLFLTPLLLLFHSRVPEQPAGLT